jgi:hypothetical protein
MEFVAEDSDLDAGVAVEDLGDAAGIVRISARCLY